MSAFFRNTIRFGNPNYKTLPLVVYHLIFFAPLRVKIHVASHKHQPNTNQNPAAASSSIIQREPSLVVKCCNELRLADGLKPCSVRHSAVYRWNGTTQWLWRDYPLRPISELVTESRRQIARALHANQYTQPNWTANLSANTAKEKEKVKRKRKADDKVRRRDRRLRGGVSRQPKIRKERTSDTREPRVIHYAWLDSGEELEGQRQ